MLAVVFVAEWSMTYVYGRPSPLNLTISHWNQSLRRALQIHLSSCSACYYACKDYVLHNCPGKEMVLPDTLSCFKPKPGPEVPLDIAIHHAQLSPIQKEALQLAFEVDVGWPNNIKEIPHPLHPHWQNCESLTVENGLVLHGEALIIPPLEREKVLGTLQQSHQGITKTQLLAHGCISWPGINKAMKEAVWQCET